MAGKRVAVIGAGLGGLSAAARLANSGYDVTVFEKNSQHGGKANQIINNGFRFDTGPSLLTMPFVIEELFFDLGENLSDYLQIKQLETICKYFWEDGISISAYSNKEKFGDEIEKKTKDRSEALFSYLSYTETIYRLTSALFLFNDFSDWKSLLNLNGLKTLLQIWKIDPFRTMHRANSSFFSDKKMIQLFNRYATYNGSNPYKAPATLNIIPHVEYNMGGFVPTKGIYSLSDAVYNLAKMKGARFEFNTEIKQILLDKKKVSGLTYLQDKHEVKSQFDIIVSNADVHYTNTKLLSNQKGIQRRKNFEQSTSALVFYWGVKGNYPALDVHNIIFSQDYEKEFNELFEKKIFPSEPTVYIYVSSKYNKSDAPEGCENWFVMINAPARQNQNIDKVAEVMKEVVLNRIFTVIGIDLRGKIITEAILTPNDIECKTSSYLGSLYGMSSNNKSAAFLRQKNKSDRVSGLYYCGGSAHPGGGIPLVLLSGKITAELISKNE